MRNWKQFIQQIVDLWTNDQNVELNVRPHWAKQWQAFILRNQPIEKYLKDSAYKQVIPKFK